jgi:hypothetical protein
MKMTGNYWGTPPKFAPLPKEYFYQKVEIVCGEGKSAYKVVLTGKDLGVFKKASENPGVIAKEGEALVAAILATGGILEIERSKGGKRNNGANGEPAVQHFDDSGKMVSEENYKDGKLVKKHPTEEELAALKKAQTIKNINAAIPSLKIL